MVMNGIKFPSLTLLNLDTVPPSPLVADDT